ncbi:hypothetical protein GCM10028805_06330 [Spirosoma harenae]
MKKLLYSLSGTLLLGLTLSLVQAQSNAQAQPTPPDNDTALVAAFLNDITSGHYDAARNRMTDDFRAYGPDYDDYVSADNLLQRSERNQYLFTHQKLTIDQLKSVTVTTGERKGKWVFVKGVWSAEDGRQRGNPIRMTFHELFRLSNDKIDRTYISYGNDQIFYDLGFPLYADGPTHLPLATKKK